MFIVFLTKSTHNATSDSVFQFSSATFDGVKSKISVHLLVQGLSCEFNMC